MVIQLVVAFVLLLAGARMPDAAALGSADETVAARGPWRRAAQFNFYAYPLTMGLMIGLTLIYRRLRGGNRRLGVTPCAG